MAKITEDKIQEMIQLYKEGNNLIEISKILKIKDATIANYLDKRGVRLKKKPNAKLSTYEKELILSLYEEGNFEEIFEKFPNVTRQSIYTLASKHGVKRNSYFWTKEEEVILINNYGKLDYCDMQKLFEKYHSVKAISTKAIKLGLTQPQEWTEQELEILKTYYSVLPKEDFIKLLPKRSEDAIVCKARLLGIKSYRYLNEKYSEEEEQFIIENAGIMTDEEIAKVLGRGVHGIQDKRRSLGIYYLNKDYSNYENFAKLFRGHIQDWKTKSMENCNYQCVISKSKNFAIHHLYGFNLILKEVFEKLDEMNLLKSDNLEDYSKEELNNIINIFHSIHNSYSLGVCVDKEIHSLFHKIYGSGGNTEEQWNKFVTDYNNNRYDELLAS